MRIDPILQALRGNPTPQRRAQRAVEGAKEAWKRHEDVALMLEELEAYGVGASLDHCPMLDSVINEPHRAAILVNDLCSRMGKALDNEPLGQVPFRHQYAGGISVVQLAEYGRAALSLVCYERLLEDRRETAQTVCFVGGERHEIYLAGSASSEIIEIIEEHSNHAVLDRRSETLAAGGTLSITGERMTKLVRHVHGRLVMLRLSRAPAQPQTAREFRLDNGQLVHRASGQREESRLELAMALLGQMGRTDAADALEDIAFEGSDHIRWQALRTCLSLDTGRGFAALSRIASNPADSLSEVAGSLRASLIEAHPQLSQI